jgi:hypothetical protein
MKYSDTEMLEATREVISQISHDVRMTGAVAPSVTNQVIRIAIEQWPSIVPLPHPFIGRDAHRAAARGVQKRIVKTYEDRYGMGIIATIIVSAIVQQVVAAIIRRWWDNTGSWRRQVRAAQYGMKNG